MSNIITTTGRSISTVTAEIVAISNQAAQMAYMSMIEIGKRLVEAKDLVEHGEWGDWLKNEVNFSQRTANNFMNIYRRSLDGNSQAFANLDYSHIVQLLALPEGELEEFTENHDVQSMSVRELKEAIAEEKRLRSEAEGKLDELTGQNSSLQATVNTLRSDTKLMENANEVLRVEADTLRNKAEVLVQNEGQLKKRVAHLEKKLARAEQAESVALKEAKRLRENPEIPDAMKDQMIADARAEAAREVRAEMQAEIDAARAELQKVSEERAAAEKAAQDNQKAEKLANPDAVAFNMLGKQILEDFNRLEGYRIKVVAKDPDMDPRMRAFMKKLAEKIMEKVGA